MKFLDPDGKGELRTLFHMLDTDLQLALEELDHTLSLLGLQVIIVNVKGSDVDISIAG